jgi:lycopene cyclase domain-containing protein
MAIGLAAVLLATAIFDNVIIGTGIVAYDPARISGVRIGLAPIEDFAYAIAAAVLLPSLWMLLRRPRANA